MIEDYRLLECFGIPTVRVMNTSTLDELAHLVTSRGVAGTERELNEFAGHLTRAGIAPKLTSIILDRTAPSVVRERAFALSLAAARHAPAAPAYAA